MARIITLFLMLLLLLPAPASSWTYTAEFGSGTVGQLAQGESGVTTAGTAMLYSVGGHTGQGASVGFTTGNNGWTGATLNAGGLITLPAPLVAGNNFWYRAYVRLPSGWSWTTSGYVVIMRVAVSTYEGAPQCYLSLLSNTSGRVIFENTCESPAVYTDLGINHTTVVWQSFDFYIRFSTVAPIVKIWKSGAYIGADTTHKTLKTAQDIVPVVAIFSYWDGGAPQNQTAYVDNIKLTNEMPNNIDGNEYHFLGLVSSQTPDTIAPAAPTAPAVAPASMTDVRYTIDSRTYQVHKPNGYSPATAYPLVVYLHGGGGTIMHGILDKISLEADARGFIAAYPRGLLTTPGDNKTSRWNGGAWDSTPASGTCCGTADDLTFLAAMIAKIRQNYNVDATKIYVTGISNGALMAHALACAYPSTIAAVAAVAPTAVPDSCVGVPVPSMTIHGTGDMCNNYDTGAAAFSGCGDLGFSKMSATNSLARLQSINGNTGNSVIYSHNNATCTQYTGTKETTHCKVVGMGHTYPNGAQYLPIGVVGAVSTDITFEQIWDFFLRNHK